MADCCESASKNNEVQLKLVNIAAFILSAFYFSIALAAPITSYLKLPAANTLYKLGKVVCIQRPSRCLWLLDDHMALCGKCFGFYGGLLITSVLGLFFPWPKAKSWALWVGLLLVSGVFSHSVVRAYSGAWQIPVWGSVSAGVAASLGVSLVAIFLRQNTKGDMMKLFAKWGCRVFLAIFIANVFLVAVALSADKESVEARTIFVPSGTPVILEVDTGFNTEEVKEGDYIALRVQRPVRVDGQKVIRQGVAARARIIGCKPAEGWGGNGECVLGLRSVPAIDGTEILLSGRVSRKGESEHGAATAVGVGAGLICLPFAAAGFAVKGEEGNFPPGYEIVAHIDGDYHVKLLPQEKLQQIEKEQKENSERIQKKFKDQIEEIRKKKAEEKQSTGSNDPQM